MSLEAISRRFLENLAKDDNSALILSFIANAGYITRSDITQYVIDCIKISQDDVNNIVSNCISYGFVIEDEVCLTMPDYLVRGAKSIGKKPEVEIMLKKIWEMQAEISSSIKMDESTSIAVLNEHCLSLLRAGKNNGAAFESIILPSQCLRVAKSAYDNEDYEKTIDLCEKAYVSRASLSSDGIVETLRYCGLAAARLGNAEYFKKNISNFLEIRNSTKAKRICHFLCGFNYRLDGEYDKALAELKSAYKLKGSTDIHILRELAYISLHIGEISDARGYISSALSRADSNHYVLELAVRAELLAPPEVVASRSGVCKLNCVSAL